MIKESKVKMSTPFKTVIAVSSVVLATAAIADGEYRISYTAGELSSHAGVVQVHERIVEAARDYCPTYMEIRSHSDVKTCVDGVVDDLVSSINHPTLSGYHNSDADFEFADINTVESDRS